MCASDVLISDYSSIVFWVLQQKTNHLLRSGYVNELRGAYFDLEEINCGTICKSEEELYASLDVSDAPFYEDFYNQFCSLHDGNSTQKIIDYMLKKDKKSLKSKIKNIF